MKGHQPWDDSGLLRNEKEGLQMVQELSNSTPLEGLLLVVSFYAYRHRQISTVLLGGNSERADFQDYVNFQRGLAILASTAQR